MRILFQLAYPAFLRMYGGTIRLLAERGHEVLVAYDRPEKRGDGTALPDGVQVVAALPSPTRRVEPAIGRLRASADYLRYTDPRFAGAPYLRTRLEKNLDGRLRALTRLPYGSRRGRAGLHAALALERLVPTDGGVTRALAGLAPDVTVVSPLIGRGARSRAQTDTVKSARKLGIPVAFAVASWDHLTTKGTVKAQPDRTLVWNDLQARDAAELHRVPRRSVVVTGAQLFDPWFERGPSTTADELAALVGVSPPYVLYAGSSPNIAPAETEIPYVRRWAEALRGAFPDLGVLVRPHPYNVEAWAGVDDLAVAPRVQPQVPMTEADDALYFDSIHHAAAVVGINTSAMVESFIQRKPVLTLRDPAFAETQEGTPHFKELRAAAGPALRTAGSVEEHVDQLRETLADPGRTDEAATSFLRVFVRPRGLDRPATPIVADAIEGLAR